MQLNKYKIILIISIVFMQLLSSFVDMQAISNEKNSIADKNTEYELAPPTGTYHLLSENKKVTIPFEFSIASGILPEAHNLWASQPTQ